MILLPLKKLLHPQPYRHRAHYQKVLGTSMDLQFVADNLAAAQEAEVQVLLEIDRLEGIYSRYWPGSELSRWQKAGEAVLSSEMIWLLHQAKFWQERTLGSFNPAVEALQTIYQQNPNPDPAQLVALRTALQAPMWELTNEQARKITPLLLNFNALAKGRIADQACAVAQEQPGIHGSMVNLGGDLRHQGKQAVEVLITNPFSAGDNAPPLARLHILNQGVATSGHTQRGQHLFDPRSAQPVQHISQATAIAADAATADVLATVFCVQEVGESLELAQELGVGCLIVDRKGAVYPNARFESQCQKPLEESV